MTALIAFPGPARAIIVAAAIAIVVVFLKMASSILAPMLLAVFIAVVAAPGLRWMQRIGVPKWGALALIAFVLLDLGSILALVSTGALEGFRDSLPTYQERLITLSEQFGQWLEGVGFEDSSKAVPDMVNAEALTGLVRIAVANLGSVLATGFLILLAVIFMLLEAPGLQNKLKAAFGMTEEAEARLQRVLASLNQYMVIKILTSLATALVIWIWLRLFGIDFAVLWAILAFVLNFIPYVGALLMTIPGVVMALVQADLQTALLVALGYVAANTVIGSVLEPRIMGRGLGISTLAVFLSLLFWSWVFGTIGAFLSVPLTMALMIALDASPVTRPIAVLLGPELAKETAAEEDATDRQGPPEDDSRTGR
jgi:predicted PurR-regulated permease PerM